MMDTILARSIFTEELYQLPERVIVLIPEPWDRLAEADQLLLTRILGSVKLSLSGVQVIAATSFSLDEAHAFAPGRILSFGVDVAEVSSKYEVVPAGNALVIVADAVDKLDDASKKILWLALRQAFGL